LNPVLDIHIHTIASGHAYSTVTEYAREAAAKGLELIAVTDHSPAMPGAANKFYFINMRVLPRRLNGVEILRGVELNILDPEGTVDLGPGVISRLDFAIASIHTPCFKGNLDDYTEVFINAMKNPHVKVIGHVCDPRYLFDMDEFIRAAEAYGVYPEVNNASLKPGSSRFGGDELLRRFLGLCVKRGLPVCLGSDAHYHGDVGNFDSAVKLLQECEVPERLVLNTSVEKFKEALGIAYKEI